MAGERISTVLRAAAIGAAAGVCLAANVSPARAADASIWAGDTRSSVRLIAGAASGQGTAKIFRAGVEMKLAAGWKTYWRYPGDSGVPPRFDFARSQNVRSIAVAWPAPHAFSDPGGKSIGYVDEVTFPLRILALDPSKPVIVRLDVDYAVCQKLCVPAVGKLELELTGASSSLDPALAEGEARVPKPSSIGDGGALAIRAVRLEGGAARPRILVDVVAAAAVELFAEGPTPDWALPIPEPIPGDFGPVRRFGFDVDGLPAGATINGATLRLTAVSGPASIEVMAHLD